MLRHFEVFLACRYLRKKRLAFFSIAAVALSVAMLIVVSSVMGGFVQQFSSACHGFYGDIIIRSDSLMGFPYYDELIAEALKLDGVKAATPVINLPGLLRIDQEHRFKLFVKMVNIRGIRPDSYDRVANFKPGLWRQSKLDGPPTLSIPPAEELSDELYSNRDRIKGACIVGTEVVYNRSPDGNYHRQNDLYNSSVILSVMSLRRSGLLDPDSTIRYLFVLIDDSETAVPLVDEETVYIPFDLAQQMSRMAAYRNNEDGSDEPAKTSQVQIRTAQGIDLQQLRLKLQDIWLEISQKHDYDNREVVFQTWNEQEGVARLIAQLERDRTLMTILFVIMDVVCVFLILCIFFVIVTEKIPDIGILKSIGASGFGVWRVFLGYAVAIGAVGSLLGLALGWPFVVHINGIHDWISHTFGWQIYDPSVLLFPHIPKQVDWFATVNIMIAAVAACLVGAMIPAIRAALMKPIKALRYE